MSCACGHAHKNPSVAHWRHTVRKRRRGPREKKNRRWQNSVNGSAFHPVQPALKPVSPFCTWQGQVAFIPALKLAVRSEAYVVPVYVPSVLKPLINGSVHSFRCCQYHSIPLPPSDLRTPNFLFVYSSDPRGSWIPWCRLHTVVLSKIGLWMTKTSHTHTSLKTPLRLYISKAAKFR